MVWGQGKALGEYRRIPNWISPAGCTMEQARFVSIAADKRPVAIAILTLYERMKKEMVDLIRSQYAIHCLDWILFKTAMGGAWGLTMACPQQRQTLGPGCYRFLLKPAAIPVVKTASSNAADVCSGFFACPRTTELIKHKEFELLSVSLNGGVSSTLSATMEWAPVMGWMLSQKR